MARCFQYVCQVFFFSFFQFLISYSLPPSLLQQPKLITSEEEDTDCGAAEGSAAAAAAAAELGFDDSECRRRRPPPAAAHRAASLHTSLTSTFLRPEGVGDGGAGAETAEKRGFHASSGDEVTARREPGRAVPHET